MLCLLAPGSSGCLRKQASKYLALSKQAFNRGVRDTLEDLSLLLEEKAGDVDKV